MAKKNNGASNLSKLLAAMQPQALPQLATTTAPSAPAATAPLPAWVDAAIAAQPAKVATVPQAPKQPASLTRSWSIVSTGVSKAGNPHITFQTQTSNGRSFNVTVPADLVAFIAAQAN